MALTELRALKSRLRPGMRFRAVLVSLVFAVSCVLIGQGLSYRQAVAVREVARQDIQHDLANGLSPPDWWKPDTSADVIRNMLVVAGHYEGPLPSDIAVEWALYGAYCACAGAFITVVSWIITGRVW
jgi:hypothetical protein